MLERFLGFLEGEEEDSGKEYSLEVGEVAGFFRERRSGEMEGLEERGEELRQEISQEVGDLGEEIEELRDFHDPDLVKNINDIVRNIGSKRQSLLNRLSLEGDYPELKEELDGFLEEFGALTPKEQAVVGRVDAVENVFGRWEELRDRRDDLEEFLDDYRTVSRYGKLGDIEERITEREGKLEGLREEGEDLSRSEEIEEMGREMEELRDSEEWREMEELEERVEEIKGKEEEIEESLRGPLSRMKRGLKKIVYGAENGKLDMSGEETETLRSLKEGELPTGGGEVVRDLPEKIEGEEVLEGRYRESFLEAAGQLAARYGRLSELDSLREEREGLEEDIGKLSLREEEEELREDIETEKERLREERNRLEREIKDIQDSIQRDLSEMEEILNEEFPDEITVRHGS